MEKLLQLISDLNVDMGCTHWAALFNARFNDAIQHMYDHVCTDGKLTDDDDNTRVVRPAGEIVLEDSTPQFSITLSNNSCKSKCKYRYASVKH